MRLSDISSSSLLARYCTGLDKLLFIYLDINHYTINNKNSDE